MSRAHRCRSNVLKLQIDTPFNSYLRHSPIRCSDPWVCPGCADDDYRRRRDNWQNEAQAVLDAGVPIVGFSFLVTLPRWNDAIRVVGCDTAEIFGRLCNPTAPCLACAGARTAHGEALAAEEAVWEALRVALRTTLPEHGGWHARTLEPLDGLDGDITLRYTVFVPAAELRRDGLPSMLPGAAAPVLQQLQAAVEATLDEVGGAVRGCGTHTWTPTDAGSLMQVLDALFRPPSIRLASLVDNGLLPVPGAVARWARAWALSIPSRSGKTRRATRSGKWGRLAGCQQAEALRALLIDRRPRDPVPTHVTILDRLRIVARSGHTVTLQSYHTGELSAIHRADLSEHAVDSRGNRGAEMEPEWQAKAKIDADTTSARLPSITHPPTFALSDLRAETPEGASPKAEPVVTLDDFGRAALVEELSRGLAKATPWGRLEYQLVAALPDARPVRGLRPGWHELRKTPGQPLSDGVLDGFAAAAAAGWTLTTAVNDVAGVRVAGPRVTANPGGGPVRWERVRIDADLQKSKHTRDELLERLTSWGLPIDEVVASGSGGVHVDVLLTPDPTGAEYLFRRATVRRLHRALAPYGVDMSTATVNHAFKPAGALSWKGGIPRMARQLYKAPNESRIDPRAVNVALDAGSSPMLEDGWQSDGTQAELQPKASTLRVPAANENLNTLVDGLSAYLRGKLEDGPAATDDQSALTFRLLHTFADMGATAEQILDVFEEYGVDSWRHWNVALPRKPGQRAETLDLAWIAEKLARYGYTD